MVQLAAAWIIEVLTSKGGTPFVPEPIRIAFRSFSDIKNMGTYTAPKTSLLLQAGCKKSVDSSLKFREWWRIVEGNTLTGPFDVSEDLVAELLRILEEVSVFSNIMAL